MTPSPLCLSAVFSTRTWLSRKKASGVELDSHTIVAHLQKNYPTLKPREVEYVVDNAQPTPPGAEFMAHW